MVAFITSITPVQRCFVATTGKDLQSVAWLDRLRQIGNLHFLILDL